MQMYSIWGWSSRAWLHTLKQPALVISGDDDPLVPVENSYLLAAHIPGARLRIVRGAGHLFLIDQAEEPAAMVTRFLRAGRAADDRDLTRQPDWTYDPIDSGKWPAARLTEPKADEET